jgi:DNA-binding response OmpR family regulator
VLRGAAEIGRYAKSNPQGLDSAIHSGVIHLPENKYAVEYSKILVVEDDRDFSEVLKDYLESVPYNVVTAENGVEGLREVMAGDFDLIVCDMMMPKLSGEMFYRAVSRVKPALCERFIFITGFRSNPGIDKFIREIKGTILPKPFHMELLRESISFVLKRR